MRIISGRFKGRTVNLHLPGNIRPSTDSVREAIFNSLSNYTDFEGLRVLDLFSGSGLFGFESLSRGAVFCHFVDRSASAVKLINSTVKILNINAANYKITLADVFTFLNTYEPKAKFDLIFSDPPYHSNLSQKLFSHSRFANILATNAIIVSEIFRKEALQIPPSFELLSKKNYGDTSIFFLMLKDQEA